eukprot:15469294-Alexandrium_andersonii.AAC.1
MQRERRKLPETARNCWNPLELAGTVEEPPLRTLRCRPMQGEHVQSPRGALSGPPLCRPLLGRSACLSRCGRA